MPRIKLLKSGELSEESIHRAVIQWVRLQPSLARFIMHFPNEGKRSPRYGKLMKDLGMRAGVSDIFIALNRNGYPGAWIELKTVKGRLTPEQKLFIDDMIEAGYYASVCRSIDETIETIKWYCFN